jgi:segregation and condensation protein B
MFPPTSGHPLAQSPRRYPPVDQRLPSVYQLLREVDDEDTTDGEQARDLSLAMVEAALFSADEPLTLRKLTTATGATTTAEVRTLVLRLRELYEKEGSAFEVAEVAGGYQLLTRPEFHAWLARLRRSTNDLRLSSAARETLAIVAYKQPITRADVEVIRGVQCSEILAQLMEKGLVRIAGRDDSLGRPMLYGTTKKFLQVYGLKNLSELPQAEQLRVPKGEA